MGGANSIAFAKKEKQQIYRQEIAEQKHSEPTANSRPFFYLSIPVRRLMLVVRL